MLIHNQFITFSSWHECSLHDCGKLELMHKAIVKAIFIAIFFFLNLTLVKDGYSDANTPCSSIDPPYTIYAVSPNDSSQEITPKAGEVFSLVFASSAIKAGDQYLFKVRQEGGYSGTLLEKDMTAGGDGSIVYNDPSLNLAYAGTYKVQLFSGSSLGSQNPICASDPLTIDPSTTVPPPTDSCILEGKIINAKIILSGSGTLTTGSYIPFANRLDGVQVPLGEKITIASDGSFGPKEYLALLNYQGGNTTIGVMHSYYTSIRCTAELTLPNTEPAPALQCPKKGETFDPKKHLTPELCTSGGGDSCDTGDNRGPAFKTAIGCIHTNPAEFVKDLMTFVIGIGGGLAFLMMLFGVFQMLTSAGNPETLNAGRSRLTSAVIGLLFVIFTVLLLQIIGVDILQIPGFKRN